jgi:hypothetical protein
LARDNWIAASHADVVDRYEGKSDAISLALEGLMTENTSKCSQAASTVGSAFSPSGNINIGYVDSISLVFDWCYNYLTSGEKSDLISKILSLRGQHKTQVQNWFQWHSGYVWSTFAYIASVLSIEGESGVGSELQLAQNLLQNIRDMLRI